MAVAVLLPDPLILVFATGPPTTQPVDPVATTRPGAAGDTAESTPTQGKTTESKVTPSTKSDRPKVRDRIGSELHQVTDLVRSFTGGFTAPSMKATPAVRTPRGLPQARRRPPAPQSRNTDLRPHPRMRPDHDCYEDVPPTGTPLDGDWFT